MSNKFQKSIADSLMTDHRWLLHPTFLSQDSLTPESLVNVIVQALEPFKLPAQKCSAWDLSGKKRAVSVQLAKEFVIHVLRIYAMTSFLNVAREKANYGSSNCWDFVVVAKSREQRIPPNNSYMEIAQAHYQDDHDRTYSRYSLIFCYQFFN